MSFGSVVLENGVKIESVKFYEKVNRTRKGYVPCADMCRDVEGNLLTVVNEVIYRWRQYFNEHLNSD